MERQTNRLTLLAMLSTISYIGRVAFSSIPNVQPTTSIILLATLYLGPKDGCVIATISMFLSNMYLGMGPWMISQVIAYFVVIAFAYYLQRIGLNDRYFPLVALFSGLLYGFVIGLVQAPFFGWEMLVPYWLSGMTFDMYHAFGNYIFYKTLESPLRKILVEWRSKNECR